jgi:Tol biopolymer transport system component
MKKSLLLAAAFMCTCGSLLAQPKSFGNPQLLIKAGHGLMAPTWSPDGSKIAVTGDNYIGIYVADADGSNLKQVSEALGAGYKMSWSDAKSITSTPYTMVDNRRMTRIENVNVQTKAVTEVAPVMRNFKPSQAVKNAPTALKIMLDDPSHATSLIASLNDYAGKMVLNPALSPDGSKIAFQIVSNGLFVCNADGSNLVSLGKGSHPSWLPDNVNVMVTRIEDNGDVFTKSDIYCVNTSNGSAVNITPNTQVIPVTIAVSPDGKKVAFDNDTDGCIYVIDLKY